MGSGRASWGSPTDLLPLCLSNQQPLQHSSTMGTHRMAPSVPTKYGMFIEHTYLKPEDGPAEVAQGEATVPAPTARDGGLNCKATIGRSGKLNDATFDKFNSLYTGDRYVDPLKVRLQAAAESKKKQINEKAFKSASPLPKSSTPGDFYGTSGKIPYMPPFVETQKVKGDIVSQTKGIFTSPAKKGTFGTNKTTLSERMGHKGVATEYEFQHEPETLVIQKRRDDQEKNRKACVSDKAFRPANPPKKGGFGVPNTTISKGKGIAGEWEYLICPEAEGSDGEKGKAKDLTPFKPTNAFASQRMEHIEYIHDPEGPKLRAESDRKKSETARLASTGAWKPSQGPKTDMVRSIVKMNLR